MNSTTTPKFDHPLGIDIGGANIKLSDGKDFSHHEPFAIWQNLEHLTSKLSHLLSVAPSHDAVIVTMTGELSDCFPNKRVGVEYICDAICEASNSIVQFYLLDGQCVDSAQAKSNFKLAAASNWHALTSRVAKSIAKDDSGLLIDIGSTTTDLIPFHRGQVVATGTDDFGRLTNHELVYTATIRTNLAGIVREVIHRGMPVPVMNEMFATTLDTNIVLGHLPAGTNQHYSSDGEPTQSTDCVRRMARLIGKDELTFDIEDAREMAEQIFERQVKIIFDAALNILSAHQFDNLHLVTSGQGEFLAKAVVERIMASQTVDDIPVRTTSLNNQLNPGQSSCATAWSLANLARVDSVDKPIGQSSTSQGSLHR